ncbi:YbaB/EbfC family nucleoid-associated protein [Paracrocinitomix mangrovi]|uniref:YbaB/EbfC family nucleoid-associated protein n=1 Tax=Paracrocinitomix mangrovi TaxID=2862509 RepID=UPI001C8EB393|nr:YbaB/EbfC family nucleoid-associated protein [Paracrocinitomix mangrovi]UKN01680.1 YbaB/EbfC family nucleoid-associated protein [Paracrocinitomix mangrovi]
MFGNDMMKKLQQMQQQVEETKKRLDNIIIEGESGGVTVKVNGNGVVKDIIGGDNMEAEELKDHIIIASNKALEQANNTKELEMASSAKGIIPGM